MACYHLPVLLRETIEGLAVKPDGVYGDKLPASGVLWSVGLGAGISYDFVQNFGLYLEPGANYYFPNSNQPRSYRTDNPWSFNVRVGFRFKF